MRRRIDAMEVSGTHRISTRLLALIRYSRVEADCHAQALSRIARACWCPRPGRHNMTVRRQSTWLVDLQGAFAPLPVRHSRAIHPSARRVARLGVSAGVLAGCSPDADTAGPDPDRGHLIALNSQVIDIRLAPPPVASTP